MKKAIDWQTELAGETSVASIKDIQSDALLHAARLVHDMSRGTKSDERSIAIDEARDAIIEEITLELNRIVTIAD